MTKKPKALGCYIFAGGFTIGVRKHFDVVAHFEEGMYGVDTAKHNIPELRDSIYTDATAWPTADYAGRVDFVYGNPPCAPWSVCSAGRAVSWKLDPRTGCAQRLFSLVESIQPKIWAWESVRPAFSKGREMVDAFVLKANDMGYDATALFVEGTRHGVPQKRPRFFLVLSKYKIEWEPTRYKGVPTVGEAFRKPFATFTCTNEGSKFFINIVKKTKQGERVAAVFNRLYPDRVAEGERTGEWVMGRPSFQNIRLDPNEPSCVLTGGAKQVHPTEHRLISIEESAVLCGYPRTFKFIGSVGKQYQQVAQAVMPPVGEYIAKVSAAAIVAKKKIKQPGFEFVEIFNDRIERNPLIALPQSEHEKNTVVREPGFISTRPKKDKGDVRGKMLRAKERRAAERAADPRARARARGETLLAPPQGARAGAGTPTRGRAGARAGAGTRADTGWIKSGADGIGRTAAVKKMLKPAKTRANGNTGFGTSRGIGARIRELIVAGKSTDEILRVVREEYPQSTAMPSDVSWNRRKLKNEPSATVGVK